MKKSILKITRIVMIITLILSLTGCGNKNTGGKEDENSNSALPTVAQEDENNCNTGSSGWKYDKTSQGEENKIVPAKDQVPEEKTIPEQEPGPKEGDGNMNYESLKDKFKANLNKNKGSLLSELKGDELNFKAEILRIGSYTSGKTFPTITLARSLGELLVNDSISHGEKYDDEYFKTKALIVIELREKSGSVRHEVTRVLKDNDQVTVEIDKTVPNIGTADMAEWAIFVELDRADIDEDTMVDFVFKEK